jgi:hypothetical protein
MGCMAYVAGIGQMKKSMTFLEKHERKRPLQRPRRNWENIIRAVG